MVKKQRESAIGPCHGHCAVVVIEALSLAGAGGGEPELD